MLLGDYGQYQEWYVDQQVYQVVVIGFGIEVVDVGCYYQIDVGKQI